MDDLLLHHRRQVRRAGDTVQPGHSGPFTPKPPKGPSNSETSGGSERSAPSGAARHRPLTPSLHSLEYISLTGMQDVGGHRCSLVEPPSHTGETLAPSVEPRSNTCVLRAHLSMRAQVTRAPPAGLSGDPRVSEYEIEGLEHSRRLRGLFPSTTVTGSCQFVERGRRPHGAPAVVETRD